jgi:uncharacterized membrane protein
MTEKIYFQQLAERLAAYPAPFRNRMYDNIRTCYQEDVQQGMHPEEIVERLGTIDDVMENVSLLYEEPVREQREKYFFSYTILQCMLVCDTIMLMEVPYGCSI